MFTLKDNNDRSPELPSSSEGNRVSIRHENVVTVPSEVVERI
jgi:hypothetical protein